MELVATHDTFLRDEDQQSQNSSKQTYSVPNKRKNDKVQEEKVVTEQQAKDKKEQAENISSMLICNYDNKLYGEDDTSQPTSRTAPIIPIEATRKKKKRKRSQISICLTNCRYESIRKVASAFGMREVSEEDAWNFYWTDMSVSVERAKEMKRFQRINHFPGMLEICRKDLLARNLNRMQKIYPKEYNFFPKTWCLPADFGEALNYSKSRKNKTFIIKPECGSQGRGIYLTKSLRDIKPTDKLICQVYLSKPYLVDGYKFDIRVYTLITSCDPLRIFVYNEGLVRYVLTILPTYILFYRCMPALKYWASISFWIINYTPTYWNLTGTDLKGEHCYRFAEYTPAEEKEPEKSPWQTQIQWEETHLGNFRRVYPVGEQYASLFQQPSGSLYTGTASSRARGDCTRLQREEFQQTKAKAEALKKPSQPKAPKEGEKKTEDGNSTATAVTTNTTTTTEKTTKTKVRAEKEQKRKEKDDKDKKLSNKPSLSQQPVSYCNLLKPNVPPVYEVRSKATTRKVPEKEIKPPYVLCSFEPDPIVEKEERERVNLLAQRDFLIRSYGMLEQIYLVMKKMGTLRPEDERKYGVYGRLSVVSSPPKTAIKKSKSVAKRRYVNGDYSESGLRVQCRDVVIYERPSPLLDFPERTTKAHLVRTAYNIWRMNSSISIAPAAQVNVGHK
ncbi:hypothetical protein HF086_005891 [Spodoptera exigua]|uniref:Uncharacterized protein n=1 Tax=Spodoptera exigua TaxID=7107 RepID=A0A922SCR7_SPOEX|nr:hypothetical protein HF086_005891 [Spodoptera exigua]